MVQTGKNPDGSPKWGYDPKYMPGQKELRAAGRNTTSINMARQQTAMEKTLGQGFANAFTKRSEDAIQAQGTVAMLDEMVTLLDSGVQTGFGQEFLNNARRLGLQMGIDVNMGELAGGEALNALSNQMVMPLVKQLGVNPTDKDLAFIVQATPTLGKTPEGNRLIIKAVRRAAQRQIEIARLQETYYRDPKNNRSMVGFERAAGEYFRQNPIFTPEERNQLFQLVGGGNAPEAGQPGAGNNVPRYGGGGGTRGAISPEALAEQHTQEELEAERKRRGIR